jgi:hypothetical protein
MGIESLKDKDREKEKEIKYQIGYQYQVYSSSQSLIPLADAKAGAIIGANIALVATLINAPFFYDKLKKIMAAGGQQHAIFFMAAAFALISVISIMCALMVLYPRPSDNKTKLHPARLTFFEHIFSCGTAERYMTRVNELDGPMILQEICVQNYELSTILIAKYKMLKFALTMFLINMVLWALLIFEAFKTNA